MVMKYAFYNIGKYINQYIQIDFRFPKNNKLKYTI